VARVVFSARLTTLDRDIAKGHLSVCLSVCHTDPRLDSSRYTSRTMHFYYAEFPSHEFMVIPKLMHYGELR